MKKILIVLSCILFNLTFPTFTLASTNISGTLSESTTWSRDGSPYIISGTFTIPTGVTLTIEPGVVIKNAPSAGFSVSGSLLAEGTGTNPITFTSLADDSIGGDTNGDGDTTLPAPRQWGKITGEAGGSITLRGSEVRYGGSGVYEYYVWDYATIRNNGATVMLGHTTITGGYDGIHQRSGTLSMSDSTIAHMDRGLWIEDGTATIRGTTFSALGIGMLGSGPLIQFGHNTFTSTPIALQLDHARFVNEGGNTGSGTMQLIALAPEYGAQMIGKDTLPYELLNTVLIPAGMSVTIDPGAVFKSRTGGRLSVAGSLMVGTSTGERIIFTSAQDDAVLGDSNGDGTQTLPHGGDWGGIETLPGATLSLTNTTLSYGGAPVREGYVWVYATIRHKGGSVVIDQSTIDTGADTGIYQSEGTLRLTHSTLSGMRQGVAIDAGTQTLQYNRLVNLTTGIAAPLSYGGDATHNWWGDSSGPYSVTQNPHGTGAVLIGDMAIAPWLTEDPDAQCTVNCYSNVMFLPGIEASRLYRLDSQVGELTLWEPSGDALARELILDSTGSSVRHDIYTKVGDILGSSYAGTKYYASFIDDMNALKSSGAIVDWQPIAYDWRLSAEQILAYGKQDGTHISYLQATDTPYIIQELTRLAASSKTGKVTIVTHSNGGLIAKALMQKIGATTTARLIDNVILVASPQVGTPKAVGALLYGYDQGFPEEVFTSLQFIATPATMRAVAKNSPAANTLLPSAKYFDLVRDINHPVVQFDATHEYQSERDAYGNLIGNKTELTGFLSATEGGRVNPESSDIGQANVLNPFMLTYAMEVHDSLDAWVPPAGVNVYQIAGWGNDTMSGIKYYEERKYIFGPNGIIPTDSYIPRYEMMTTEDGDDTVVVPSALAMGTSSDQVKGYWVDLLKAATTTHTIAKEHSNILELSELRTLIRNIITNPTAPLPRFIATERPIPTGESKKLRFFLHSPLTLEAYDSLGNHVGINATTGLLDQQIPDVTYDQFGETKILTVPEGLAFRLIMNGYASGSFSLDTQKLKNGEIVSTTGFIQIPTSTTTVASMTFDPAHSQTPPLIVDKDGNGTTDFVVPAQEGVSVSVDLLPPQTIATTTSVTGAGGWYASDVTLQLIIDDGPLGSGVASTTYSLDGIHWESYASTSPIIISAEGTTTLWYRSSDEAGNIEEATSTVVCIDKTTPEAFIHFSTSTKKIVILGTDTLSSTRVTQNATSTVLIDGAGNAITLIISRNSTQTKSATLIIPSFRYSHGSSTNATTSLKYFWSTNTAGKFTLFISAIRTPTERLIALYVPLLNKTYIVKSTPADDDVDLSAKTALLLLRHRVKTLNGMVVPSVSTKQGTIVVGY